LETAQMLYNWWVIEKMWLCVYIYIYICIYIHIYIHNRVLFSHKEEWNFCYLQLNEWNWGSDHHAKCSKPGTEGQTSQFSFICGS
jgi:hypothetical protein